MENRYVSVVIPARNEEKNISRIVNFVKKNKYVNQIIVVDNNSADNTSKLAKEAGGEVIFCDNQGKGYAMETGIQYVKNDIVVFVDADINVYSEELIDILINSILNGEADFVKSTFERITGGLVTEIAVKPLLDLLFPDIYKFSEPISGMIACKKDILNKLEFEKDYGVDIGILLDVIEMGYKVVEVNIGKLENMSHLSKNNMTMRKMSTEIISAILKRVNLKK